MTRLRVVDAKTMERVLLRLASKLFARKVVMFSIGIPTAERPQFPTTLAEILPVH
jgi:hypothetical protein